MITRGAILWGATVGGVLASACCIAPLGFALLGLSGAVAAQRFEPFRPYLLVLTYGMLGAAFYVTYRPARPACVSGGVCDPPRKKRKAVFWFAVVGVVLSTSFPWYAEYLPF